MQLLTQNLPSGFQYEFPAIEVKPMNFAQILEYLENVPKNPVEKFYFDYCLVKGKEGSVDFEPNVDNLLISDLEYLMFFKKALTISENLTIDTTVQCPRCGSTLRISFTLADIKFNKLESKYMNGFKIMFAGEMREVEIPKVSDFMEIFKKYRMYKKVEDLRMIKLISVFKESKMYLQSIENKVLNATWKDVTSLVILDDLYFNNVSPVKAYCDQCAKMYQPTDAEIFDYKAELGIKPEDELPSEYFEELKSKHGGVETKIDSLVSNFFRDLTQNNRLTTKEVLFGEVSENA